ncbi:MAG: TRAP transporter substrate-binding protein [Arenicella sp.]
MLKKVVNKALLSAALISSTALMSSTALAESKPVLLKLPVAFPTTLPGLGSTAKWLSDEVTDLSDGTIKIKVYEPKKLVAPFEILDAVSSGKVNAGFSIAGYWAGKMPAAPLFGAVPFGPEADEFISWFWHGNGMKLYQEMYDKNGYNVHVELCGINPPETSGWFAKEINSVDDLKGLKMRFFGLGGEVMQKLGVVTSLLPGGEIYAALEKGAIDATEFSMPAIDKRLGFHKLVKYNYFPGWHQQATTQELLINKNTWNDMSKHQQSVIKNLCKSSVANAIAYTESLQGAAIRENVEKNGVIIKKWSPEMLSTFEKTWMQVVDEKSAKSAEFKAVWEDLKTFRENYDFWQANAFLPRG